MHPIILAGHWRHEQSDHDLGGGDVQTSVQVHRTQRPRVGKTVTFLSGARDDLTFQTHAVFCRVSRSGRGLTTSTARLTTARSKCGTWTKTPTWKLCRYLGLRRRLTGEVTRARSHGKRLCSFGHQDAITGLDCLSRERCVTAGGRDGSVRVWKIAEESQLVFHGHG